MKVKYLINLLSKQNPNAEVRLHDFEHGFGGDDVLFVLSRKKNNKIVCIQGKSDVDLAYQIQSRYLTAKQNHEAEASYYQELHDCGITAEEISIAISPEEGDLYRRFWKGEEK